MKKLSSVVTLGLLAVSSLPSFVFGADGLLDPNTGGGNVDSNLISSSISTIIEFINSIIIPAILAIAFLAFVWGMVKYFIIGGADDGAKAQGKSLMLYAIAGFVAILIFFGLVNIVANGLGLTNSTVTPPPGVSVGS